MVRGLVGAGYWHATRIDVAVDFRGEGLRVVQDVISGCRRGEVTGARADNFKVHEQGRNGCRGLGVSIGSRGKNGSGRFVRCYDKGLETGELSANEWHRFEAEFSKDVAATALTWILQGQVMKENGFEPMLVRWRNWEPTPGWEISAAQCAFGAMDFRECNGQRSLERRPRAAWFAALLGVIEPHRVRCRRLVMRSLEATGRWLGNQVMPTLVAMSRVAGRPVQRVLEDIVGGFEVIKSAITPAVFQYELVHGSLGARAVACWPFG